ncbi:hypothetical protein MKX01_012236 [Papaver californicum]|nr:hypothetical protein MKX01_012236 [Papaver californicum]
MGRSSKKSDFVAAASPDVKSVNKRGKKRDDEEEIEIKLKKKKVPDIKKKKKIQEFSYENDSSSKGFGNRNPLVPCSENKKFSSDPENRNRLDLVPCSQKPNIGAAASSKKEEDSREEPTTASASKTVVIAGNLPFSINKSDLIDFFKQAGEVVDAHYGHYKGTCHIEFATEEAAKKAFELDGQNLCNREIGVDRYGSRTTGASKTLISKHLSLSIAKSDMINFLNGLGKLLMCVSLYMKMEISRDIAILSLQLKKVRRRQLSTMANTGWAVLLFLALLVKPYMSGVLILV